VHLWLINFEGDSMESKIYRMREFLNAADGRSLVLDVSAGLSLGPLPGLEDFPKALQPVLPLVDGLVASPGQTRRLGGRSRAEAALLVRADWTNALRGPDFVLPPETVSHIPLLEPAEALDLGVSAAVLYFLLGYEEQIEAGCLRQTVQHALQGGQAGLPLILDVHPTGPRVVLPGKAVQLGVSYAFEGGADGVAIPWPGADALEPVLVMAAGAPVWIKPSSMDTALAEMEAALELGATGLWLDERVFALPDPAAAVFSFSGRLHQAVIAGEV
jgi:DhnA family fructose-bisphosphate aldolase class Ia